MDSIAVAKPDMGVLRRERLVLSPFGALSLAFAQELLDRAGFEEGRWPFVPLDLLEEGESSASQPVQPVLQVDLSLILRAVRWADNRTELGKAAERMVERIIRLREQERTPSAPPQTVPERPTRASGQGAVPQSGQDWKRSSVQKPVYQPVQADSAIRPVMLRQNFYNSVRQHIQFTANIRHESIQWKPSRFTPHWTVPSGSGERSQSVQDTSGGASRGSQSAQAAPDRSGARTQLCRTVPDGLSADYLVLSRWLSRPHGGDIISAPGVNAADVPPQISVLTKPLGNMNTLERPDWKRLGAVANAYAPRGAGHMISGDFSLPGIGEGAAPNGPAGTDLAAAVRSGSHHLTRRLAWEAVSQADYSDVRKPDAGAGRGSQGIPAWKTVRRFGPLTQLKSENITLEERKNSQALLDGSHMPQAIRSADGPVRLPDRQTSSHLSLDFHRKAGLLSKGGQPAQKASAAGEWAETGGALENSFSPKHAGSSRMPYPASASHPAARLNPDERSILWKNRLSPPEAQDIRLTGGKQDQSAIQTAVFSAPGHPASNFLPEGRAVRGAGRESGGASGQSGAIIEPMGQSAQGHRATPQAFSSAGGQVFSSLEFQLPSAAFGLEPQILRRSGGAAPEASQGQARPAPPAPGMRASSGGPAGERRLWAKLPVRSSAAGPAPSPPGGELTYRLTPGEAEKPSAQAAFQDGQQSRLNFKAAPRTGDQAARTALQKGPAGAEPQAVQTTSGGALTAKARAVPGARLQPLKTVGFSGGKAGGLTNGTVFARRWERSMIRDVRSVKEERSAEKTGSGLRQTVDRQISAMAPPPSAADAEPVWRADWGAADSIAAGGRKRSQDRSGMFRSLTYPEPAVKTARQGEGAAGTGRTAPPAGMRKGALPVSAQDIRLPHLSAGSMRRSHPFAGDIWLPPTALRTAAGQGAAQASRAAGLDKTVQELEAAVSPAQKPGERMTERLDRPDWERPVSSEVIQASLAQQKTPYSGMWLWDRMTHPIGAASPITQTVYMGGDGIQSGQKGGSPDRMGGKQTASAPQGLNAQSFSAAPERLDLELAYNAQSQPSEADAGQLSAGGSMNSDYVRSLPDWARRFLQQGAPQSREEAVRMMGTERKLGTARTITAPRFSDGETVEWTAPDYRPPVPTEYREPVRRQEEPQIRNVHISDAEIQRTADRVYRMIEDRIRRERHRLGL